LEHLHRHCDEGGRYSLEWQYRW